MDVLENKNDGHDLAWVILRVLIGREGGSRMEARS